MIIETTKVFKTPRMFNSPRVGVRTLRYDLAKPGDAARYVAQQQFAWPGGYELFAITDDGGVLCAACCRTEYRQIRDSSPGDGWHVCAVYSTENVDMGVDEGDDHLFCAHCDHVMA